jgi:hypothetical protein
MDDATKIRELEYEKQLRAKELAEKEKIDSHVIEYTQKASEMITRQ